ncbi:hypothetical protein [Lacticaseibacillus paracasei]|uniref:hypothetical protein n=1 Tax=Lacticaseibacillus paracasei TaxID=1597 RepID=UPI001CDC3D84|nr:hypothetical protein [Lacticaseibacillus paracasei]
MRYPKRAYTFSVDYFSTPESVDPIVYSLTVMTMMPNKRLLLVVGMSFSIFALMLSKTTSDLEQSFIISYENEVKFSDKIVTSVQELGINNFDQYRLVIVGDLDCNNKVTT